MKRLTLNRIARSTLRVNKKAYISLFLGILVAVYLATATSLCAWGTIRGHEEQMAEKVGWADMLLPGEASASDEKIRSTGYFRKIGHITVDATVEGSSICTGWYDETAEELMNRKLLEGRMPEKAGEIAAERSALMRLDLENTAVGDTITLKMKPIYGVSEEKTFTLVGILNEQTDNLDTYSDEEGMRLPAMLVSPEETYNVGGVLVHRVLTYAPLITFNQVMRHIPQGLEGACGISRESGGIVYYDSGWDRASNMFDRILVWVVLGAALMLSACVGITSSMESVLAQKTQDIGMLRAIGATRRQIRRVYGAEAWVLAATALPAGMALGAMTAWIISCLAPDQVVFNLTPWLLIPILVLSALCVFAASRLPLYRASRQMPMGVLRDTAMLRKTGRKHSRGLFTPTHLIARRRAALHPFRMLGAAGMTALTLISALLLGELALGLRLPTEEVPAFRIYAARPSSPDTFTQMIGTETVSRAELNQIADIDGVSKVWSLTHLSANLLMDEVPEYFRPYTFKTEYEDGAVTRISTFGVLENMWGTSEWLFYSNEDLADARARQDEDWLAASEVTNWDQAEMLRSKFGIDEKIVPVSVLIADPDLAALQEFVTDGSIDPDRLDSGEQVLVYAPTACMRNNGEEGYLEINKWLTPGEIRDGEWDLVIRNDFFTSGTTLDLLEITCEEYDEGLYWNDADPEGQRQYFDSAEPVRASATVAAVLEGPVTINDDYLSGFTVIVSEKGAQAMGLQLPNPEYTDVYIAGNTSRAEETRIEEEIDRIALRNWMSVENQLEISREYMNRKLRQILLFTGLILLFFAVSVFMQVSGASRQIRSDTRTIGTLRAVGANLKTLVGCYRLPVWICAGLALVPPLLFYLFCAATGIRLFTVQHPFIIMPVLAVMAVCIAAACVTGIRGRLATVSRQSIVENIREL